MHSPVSNRRQKSKASEFRTAVALFNEIPQLTCLKWCDQSMNVPAGRRRYRCVRWYCWRCLEIQVWGRGREPAVLFLGGSRLTQRWMGLMSTRNCSMCLPSYRGQKPFRPSWRGSRARRWDHKRAAYPLSCTAPGFGEGSRASRFSDRSKGPGH